MAAGAGSPGRKRAAFQAAVLKQKESSGVEGGPKRAKVTGTKPATVRASDNHVSHWQLKCMISGNWPPARRVALEFGTTSRTQQRAAAPG